MARCVNCGAEVERLRRLHLLILDARGHIADPDWTDFWPAVRARIASEALPPMREEWWLPLWKPVWGHPRMALGGVLASGLVAALMLWPSPPTSLPVAVGAPVVVQDVSTADPDRSVMVYSNPDEEVTVIWVFNPGEPDEQS